MHPPLSDEYRVPLDIQMSELVRVAQLDEDKRLHYQRRDLREGPYHGAMYTRTFADHAAAAEHFSQFDQAKNALLNKPGPVVEVGFFSDTDEWLNWGSGEGERYRSFEKCLAGFAYPEAQLYAPLYRPACTHYALEGGDPAQWLVADEPLRRDHLYARAMLRRFQDSGWGTDEISLSPDRMAATVDDPPSAHRFGEWYDRDNFAPDWRKKYVYHITYPSQLPEIRDSGKLLAYRGFARLTWCPDAMVGNTFHASRFIRIPVEDLPKNAVTVTYDEEFVVKHPEIAETISEYLWEIDRTKLNRPGYVAKVAFEIGRYAEECEVVIPGDFVLPPSAEWGIPRVGVMGKLRAAARTTGTNPPLPFSEIQRRLQPQPQVITEVELLERLHPHQFQGDLRAALGGSGDLSPMDFQFLPPAAQMLAARIAVGWAASEVLGLLHTPSFGGLSDSSRLGIASLITSVLAEPYAPLEVSASLTERRVGELQAQQWFFRTQLSSLAPQPTPPAVATIIEFLQALQNYLHARQVYGRTRKTGARGLIFSVMVAIEPALSALLSSHPWSSVRPQPSLSGQQLMRRLFEEVMSRFAFVHGGLTVSGSAERPPRDLGPDDRIHAEGGSTQLSPNWLPAPRTPIRAPEVKGFVYLGEHTFSCFNDVEGLKVFTVPVYRNIRFAQAAGVRLDAPIQDRPNARMLTADTEFVLLPLGFHASFVMGDLYRGSQTAYAWENPAHEVVFEHQFLIARTPVTQRVWAYLQESGITPNPSYFDDGDWWRKFSPSGRPVEQVSWDDCVRWCARQGLRLPSEAEREFACRAGTRTRYFFGDHPGRLADFAWYSENAGATTHPVATLAANAFGLFDTLGNVFEWCADEWHDNYKGAPADGSVWGGPDASKRVFRGGSWGSRAVQCYSAFRFWIHRSTPTQHIGFRPAVSI